MAPQILLARADLPGALASPAWKINPPSWHHGTLAQLASSGLSECCHLLVSQFPTPGSGSSRGSSPLGFHLTSRRPRLFRDSCADLRRPQHLQRDLPPEVGL